jgi:hypothetical protein
MPLIIPPGFAQITFTWDGPTIPDGVAQCVFGITLVSGEPPLTALDRWVAAWVATLEAEQFDTTVFRQASLVTATVGTDRPLGTTGGRDVSETGSPATSLLINKITAVRGARAKGRMYPPSLVGPGDFGESGAINNARIDALQAAATQFLVLGSTGGGTEFDAPMVILQNTEGQSPPLSPPPEVGALGVNPVIATQRGRLR